METHKRDANDMPAEPIEVKSGWIRLKIRAGAATGAMWVRGEDIARISTISMPGVPGNPGTSQVEVNRGQDGPLLVDHSPAEIVEAIRACERAAGLDRTNAECAGPRGCDTCKTFSDLLSDAKCLGCGVGNDQAEIKCSSLCECSACKIKYLQAEVADLKSDIEYLQTSKNALLAKMDDLRGRLALARPTKEDEEAMALIRSAARALQTEKPTPDLSEGEGLQPDGSYVIKVRLGESSHCVARRHPDAMQVERGGVVMKPGVRIISG